MLQVGSTHSALTSLSDDSFICSTLNPSCLPSGSPKGAEVRHLVTTMNTVYVEFVLVLGCSLF